MHVHGTHDLLETSVSAHSSKSHITAAVQIMNDRQTLFTFIKVPQMNNSCFHISGLKIFNCAASGLSSSSDCFQYKWCICRSRVYNPFNEKTRKRHICICIKKCVAICWIYSKDMIKCLCHLSITSELSIIKGVTLHLLYKCSTQSEDCLKE